MSNVSGLVAAGFEEVRDIFEKNFTERNDLGASFCAVHNGEVIVDLWGGYLDEDHLRPWEQDTIITVYSTTKAMTLLCVLLLVDRGEIELDHPVAKYWPEFAAKGKDAISVRQVLAHSSAVPGLDEPVEPAGLYDWERMVSLIANQAPWWEPGSDSGYQGVTQGYVLGEIVRRVSGRTLGEFFKQEFAQPLDADFHIGCEPHHDERVANVIPPVLRVSREELLGSDSMIARSMGSVPLVPEESFTVAWRRAEIPAAGGISNARAVAKLLAIFAGEGEAFGKRFMQASTARLPLEEQSHGKDLVLESKIRWGLSVMLPNETMPAPGAKSILGGGLGGSTFHVDYEKNLSLSYVMNRMEFGLTGDERGYVLRDAVYSCLSLQAATQDDIS